MQSIVTLRRNTFPRLKNDAIFPQFMLRRKIAIDCIAAYYCARTAGHMATPWDGTMQASAHHHL
ncbi:hypothetical protein XAXN_05155 [Xanthomonas axonopodis]|uniref:Uncharacterized protein n=1 Tax=Xanthomonas axonopodis TaxID=53413 RepID=A0A0P6VW39_9XANT|nr:hypothetical protein XAXN_05155 [Xanthomonas axonopodis]